MRGFGSGRDRGTLNRLAPPLRRVFNGSPMARRARLLVLALLATAAVQGALTTGATGAASQLMFVTYNGTTPVVTLPGGTTVGTATPPGTLILAGSYTVEISVSSEPADFQIVGPGLSFLDNEPSTEVYTITFAASSTYSFEDVNNPASCWLPASPRPQRSARAPRPQHP